LKVSVDSQDVLSRSLPYPRSGSTGIGSYSGGVGFDDVVVAPASAPNAWFDFTDREDRAIEDWYVVRKGDEIPWCAGDEMHKDDILLYGAPPWSNSEVRLILPRNVERTFSLLFPYVDIDRFVETRVETGDEISVQVMRHFGDEISTGKRVIVQSDGREESDLVVQCVKGKFAIFLDGNNLVEENEYVLLGGTVGIQLKDELRTLPVSALEIRECNFVIDAFIPSEDAALSSEWNVQDGTWQVIPVLEEGSADDGQLVAVGKGTVLIGKENWKDYLVQVSASFDESTEIALLGRVAPDDSVEMLCKCGEVQIRRVVSSNSLPLATTKLPALQDGWHRLGLTMGQEEVIAEVDGEECLRVSLHGGKGLAGLRNYGEFVAFDNFTIHVISTEEDRMESVKNVDTLFINIEESILK